MSSPLDDLWPDTIRVDVRTPEMILRQQAEFLSRKTKSLARVQLQASQKSGKVVILFDLVAGAADRYRGRLLTAEHQANIVYPVDVTAECFSEDTAILRELLSDKVVNYSRRRAYSEEDLITILKVVFASPQAMALIQSLLAKSNEIMAGVENATSTSYHDTSTQEVGEGNSAES